MTSCEVDPFTLRVDKQVLSVLLVDCGGAVSNAAYLNHLGYPEDGADFHRKYRAESIVDRFGDFLCNNLVSCLVCFFH